MPLRAYPKLPISPGKFRVWVGATQQNVAPQLQFRVNGSPATPVPIRPIQSIRPANLLSDATQKRVFSGVYEFSNLGADVATQVSVSAPGIDGTAIARGRTLPERLSEDPERWFNVLVASCFYTAGDHAQHLAACLTQLPAQLRPNVSILAGDQVYLDLPTFKDFEDDGPKLAQRFERTYSANWFGDLYGPLLALAPTVCIPDDHEYWNNYPHASPFIGNSHTEAGRRRWTAAAMALFSGFQLGPPDQLGAPVLFDVPPLSFFIADTRSFRTADRRQTLHSNAFQWLEHWATRVRTQKLYPVFVSGQSLFESAAGTVAGTLADRSLANYGDYGKILTVLGSLARERRCLLCVTGDVHWGRVLYATDAVSGAPRAFEVICSPSSLVDSPWDIANRLRNRGSDWPLHSNAEQPPKRVSFGQERWVCHSSHAQRGDQVAILSFRRFAGEVQLRVSYWPVHARGASRRPTILPPFSLRSMS